MLTYNYYITRAPQECVKCFSRPEVEENKYEFFAQCLCCGHRWKELKPVAYGLLRLRPRKEIIDDVAD